MGAIDVAQMHARVGVKRSLKSFCAVLSRAIPERGIDRPGIVVLMYHRMNSYRKNELSVNPEEFRKQVAWLADNGFANMRMSDLESGAQAAPAQTRRVLFTFDDGYEDNYATALPILKEHAYSAIFYIPVNYISSDAMAPRDRRESNRLEDNRRMTWEQVKRLAAEGMEIGSHGLNHLRLSRIPTEEAGREIADSKTTLETILSLPVTSFCYPGGSYDAEHVSMVKKSGYRSACTAAPGAVGANLVEIPRVAVQASDTFFVFRLKMQGRLRWLRAIR